jgi:ribonuclease D
LAAVREVIAALAEAHQVLAQNLLASDVVRRLCWEPPDPVTEDTVRARLAELGARPWQLELTGAALVPALAPA